MSETKSLKSLSLNEIELAVAEAISNLTGTKVTSTIHSFASSDPSGVASALTGQHSFKIDLELSVGKSYEVSGDVPF